MATCHATGTGTWGGTDTANFTGGSGAATTGTGTGQRPGATDDLIIDSGVALTLSTIATVNSLTFPASTAGTSLEISDGQSLTSTAASSIPAAGAGGTNTIQIGSGVSGSFTCSAGITITGNATAGVQSTLQMAAGSTFNLTGTMSFAGTAAQARFIGNATATVALNGGTFSTGGAVVTNSVKITSTGTSAINHSTLTWGNWTITGGTLTLGAAQTIGNTLNGLTITNNATLNCSTFLLTCNASGVGKGLNATGTIAGSGGLTLNGASPQISGTCLYTNTGTFTVSGVTQPSFIAGANYSFKGTLALSTAAIIIGTMSSPITLQSTVGGTPFSITRASGTLAGNWLILKDSAASGGATFNARNSVDNTGNSGWNIFAPYSLTASVGSFILTGFDAIFNKTLSFVMDVGSFVLTGFSASFSKAFGALTANVGNFVLTGFPAILSWVQHGTNYLLNASVGFFTLTGEPATLFLSPMNRTTRLTSSLALRKIK